MLCVVSRALFAMCVMYDMCGLRNVCVGVCLHAVSCLCAKCVMPFDVRGLMCGLLCGMLCGFRVCWLSC